ncbi:MAG TPA: hypothetical protein VGL35_14130 [Rhizomicrobium sp.]|jgi:hypothetical protein
MRSRLPISLVVAGLMAATAPAWAGSWVAVPSVSGSTQTSVFGITDKNIITGDYTDSSGVQHGFVGPIDGSNDKSFDDPDGTTQPRAINDMGWISGFDSLSTATWERSPAGKLKPVTKSGTALDGVAQGLNASGVFGADYIDPNTGATVAYLGKKYKYMSKFKLSISNSGYAARGVDAAGDIAGWYYDPSTQLQHGFIIINGKAKTIDYPNATYTVMEGLNDNGIVPCQYEDTSGVIHGCYYDVSTKKIKSLDVPGSTLTQIWGANDKDVIAASATVGGVGVSYVYCIHTKGCPTAGALHQMLRGSPPRPAQP